MMKVVLGLIMTVALAISGCTPKYTQTSTQKEASTAPTPYQAGGLPRLLGVGIVVNPFTYPYGYQEKDLGDSSFMVIAETNVHTTKRQTYDIMKMRAAELGQQHGFDKFRISYTSAVGICRDNTGFQRNVVTGLVQYGKGEAPIGPDDRSLTRRAEMFNSPNSRMRALRTDAEFKVADVIRDLEAKVKNPVETPDERETLAKEFHDKCWGPS